MKKLIETFGFGLGCLIAIFTFAIACSISWILTCGAVWLVCLCFGWVFTWPVATGVWIVACLISALFTNKN
jgi:hypothetical protein